MKKYSIISVILSLLVIAGIIYQNLRLLEMFYAAGRKERFYFELQHLHVKVYIGLVILLNFILLIFAIGKNENKRLILISGLLLAISAILLYVRLWTFWV